jgi:hypothetical protein
MATIGVICVRTGAEHGRGVVAGRVTHSIQEILLLAGRLTAAIKAWPPIETP